MEQGLVSSSPPPPPPPPCARYAGAGYFFFLHWLALLAFSGPLAGCQSRSTLPSSSAANVLPAS